MPRYFLDTGAVVGLTFLHDLWFDEARRLFATENSLYISRPVLYEYCNSTDDNLLTNTEVDWDSEEGLFGAKLSNVRAAQVNLDLKLQSSDDEELDIESLVEDFIDASGVKENVDEASIDAYIRPNLRRFLEHEIGDREVTREVAREAMDTLCDTIQTNARDTREEIRGRVTEYDIPSDERDQFKSRLQFVDGYVDTVILSDVAWLNQEGILSKIITSDNSHMYGERERIDAVIRVTVVFLRDECADASLPE